MAFDSTVGGTNSNSYVSVVEAETYFADRGNPTTWTDANPSLIEAALIYATTWLDANISWNSSIYTTTQSLNWPRIEFYDIQGRVVGGDGVIPEKVKHAVFELALQWLKEDFTSTDNEGIASESIGGASVVYKSNTKNYTFLKSLLQEYGTISKSKNPTLYRA